uniref:Uncharacterized protein n=1 Tax=Plectus sambesii TaxID=2011161 RepID=A0A914X323_9BILA
MHWSVAALPLLLSLSMQQSDAQSLAFVDNNTTTTSTIFIRVNSADYTSITSLTISIEIFNLDNAIKVRTDNISLPVQPLYNVTGLNASTWYALRIKYKVAFRSTTERSMQQDLVLRTQNADGNQTAPAFLTTIDGVSIKGTDVFVSIKPLSSDRLSLIVLPELRCDNGIVRPEAQRLSNTNRSASFRFDMTIVTSNLSSCDQLCVYPFVRVQMLGDSHYENFRAKDWCGSIAQAVALAEKGAVRPTGEMHVFLYFIIFGSLVHWLRTS